MTKQVFCIILIILFSSLSPIRSQDPENNPQVSEHRPGLISRILMFLGLKSGYSPNLLQILMTVGDLYKHDAFQKCYSIQEKKFEDLRTRLIRHPHECFLDSCSTIKDNLNISFHDIYKTLAVLKKELRRFRKGERIGALLELTIEETDCVADMLQRANAIWNATVTLKSAYSCMYTNMSKLYQDFRKEMQDTLICLEDELGENSDRETNTKTSSDDVTTGQNVEVKTSDPDDAVTTARNVETSTHDDDLNVIGLGSDDERTTARNVGKVTLSKLSPGWHPMFPNL